MKKWNLLLSMLFIASAIFVTSCSKDETTGPSLDLKGTSGYTSNDVTITAGSTIKIGVIANAGDKNLTHFQLTSTHDNVAIKVIDSTLNSSNFNLDLELTFTDEFIGDNRLQMTITDKDGNEASQSFKVTVEDGATPVNKYSDVLLGSYNDAIGSFYSTSENKVYVRADVRTNPTNQAKIDFIFFKGDANANSLAAPIDEAPNSITDLQMGEWTVKNNTLFQKTDMSAADFNAIGDTYNFDNFTGNLTIVNQLENDDVIMFQTVQGKLGLILVKAVSRGDEGTFDIIVQQ